MSARNHGRKWIDPEAFYVARRRAGMDTNQAAALLDVNERTIRNWENSRSAIPYAAFKVMRHAGGYMLADKTWEGWTLWRGLLYTPENQSFAQHELRYVANYLWMARQWLKERKQAQETKRLSLLDRSVDASKPPIPEVSPTASEKASPATAGAGASPFRDMPCYFGTAASLYGKTIIGENAGNTSVFWAIDASQKIAANDDSYREVL